jgi:AcrR family transcriptional regulator
VGSAFTDKQATKIREKLKENAKRCLIRYGIKKTTVDQLAREAGISKGAFYRFYDSKELLFFEIVEDIHAELYGGASEILKSRTDLPDVQRMELALLLCLQRLDALSVTSFWGTEMEFLLSKIPEDVLEKHYHSDDAHIRELLWESGIEIPYPAEYVSAMVRALLLMLSHKKQIGESCYENVMKLMIKGVCQQLLRKDQ